MVDTQLLDERIAKSGKRKSYLAEKCGMSLQTFRMKRLNISPFNTDEIEALAKELDIRTMTDKERIFFKKKVEKTST